ncbi:MAG: hypothetical protein ACFCGT_28525 [Sandaracinaceae bacterium]
MPRPELTDQDIRTIRQTYAQGEVTQRDIAEDYGVSVRKIAAILRGEIRPAAGGPLRRPDKRRRLTPRSVKRIRQRYADEDLTVTELAKEHGLAVSTVSRLVRGESHARADGPRSQPLLRPPRLRVLQPEQVEEILSSPAPHNELAKRFGVSRQAVQQLRQRWGWIRRPAED